MPTKPRILKRQLLASTRFFRVEELEMEFGNGSRRNYERLQPGGRGAVLIAAAPDDQTVLLIREYAAGLDRYTLGFPKGAVDQGENILEAANRELMEEAGFGARKLRFLKRLYLSPSYMSNFIDVVLATDLYPKRLAGDEPEDIEVIPWRLDNLAELLEREDFCEGRSIAALFMVRELLQNERASRDNAEQ